MAFRVKPDGTIECDSPEEAISLSKKLAGSMPGHGKNGEPERPTAVTSFETLVKEMPEKQRRILRALRDKKTASLEELRSALPRGESKFAFSGTIAGVLKNLKKAGIDSGQVFTNKVTGSGARRESTYYAGALL